MFSNLQKKESGTEVFCWSRRRKDGTIEYAHGKPFHFFINKQIVSLRFNSFGEVLTGDTSFFISILLAHRSKTILFR